MIRLRTSSLVLAFLLGAPIGAFAAAPQPAAVNATKSKAAFKRPFKPGANAALPASWHIAGQQYLSPTEYSDLSNGVQALLKRYPADKYFFVGLGRDPAPVIAFLQNLGEKGLAVNLPGTSNIAWVNKVNPATVKQHIEAAVPEEVLSGERQIVILDVTSSGKTPAKFGPEFDNYLQSRGINKKVVRLAFSWQNVMQGGHGPALTDWINTSAWADFGNYYSGKYEGSWTPQNGGQGIGEHQRHSMESGLPPTATNPNYAAFRKHLMERMEQDSQLDQFLSQHGGHGFRNETPEEAAVRVAAERVAAAKTAREAAAAERQRVAAERIAAAAKLTEAKSVPAKLTKELSGLVQKLTALEGEERHAAGYLNENGKAMNAWLKTALGAHADAGKLVPAIAKQGANAVVSNFMDEVERARKTKKIRNRDYRRLMGHALSAANMDAAMVTSLVQRFGKSRHFRREITEESAYYLNSHTEKARPETVNMAAAYKTLIAALPSSARAEIKKASAAE